MKRQPPVVRYEPKAYLQSKQQVKSGRPVQVRPSFVRVLRQSSAGRPMA